MNDFVFRYATPDDKSFIERSWFESYWKTTMMGTPIKYDDYQKGQDGLIKRLVSLTKPVVLCYKPEPTLLVGYIVSDKDTLHWVYVKSIYRRQHVAKALLGQFPTVKQYSHNVRRGGAKFLASTGLNYNPYSIMETQYEARENGVRYAFSVANGP